MVEVDYSFVSRGTELTTVDAVAEVSGLTGTVAKNPSLIGKTAAHIKEHGLGKTIAKVRSQRDALELAAERLVTIGYSCAGRVVAITSSDTDKSRRTALAI